jgi:ring-1,2-phenylacetyl-CoA epoxidase subunit PaaE
MLHFHPLPVKEVRRETADCVSILFDVPPALQEAFRFEQGQNITIKATIAGQELRRSYSICTAPFEGELRVAVKQVEGGQFSTYANQQLRPGDVLEVMPPTGRFNTALQPQQQKQYLAFAAGSGITPILSLIKTTLRTEPNSRFTLVYGNRSRASIIFFEELEALKNNYLQRFHFINILSREKTESPLSFGRIDTDKLQALGKLIRYTQMDEVFLCGPESMIFCVKDYLTAQGMDAKKIHFELFATPGQSKVAAKVRQQSNNDGPQSQITVQLDGRSFAFALGFDSDSILDAALKQGADLPFACKGGVCCTCKAKLLQGEVEMEVNYGLEHEEVEQGFILTCQARPVTEKIVVDFDIK